MPTILFADDHELIREAVKPYLMQLVENVKVAEAGSYGQAFDVATKLKASDAHLLLVLLDLTMPGLPSDDIFSGLRKIKLILPDIPLVVFSGNEDPNVIREAIASGAQGFVPKSTRGRSLVNALRLVLAGEVYVPPVMAAAAAAAEPVAAAQAPEELSARELESLRMLVRGMSNKEIARELGLQAVTVKLHLRKAYRKIGAANRLEAVRIAVERRIA